MGPRSGHFGSAKESYLASNGSIINVAESLADLGYSVLHYCAQHRTIRPCGAQMRSPARRIHQ